MSYNIAFIKTKDLNYNNLVEMLEGEVCETDEHYVSPELITEIREAFEKSGLKFDVSEGGEEYCLVLSFQTYYVSMFNSQVSVSIPYWKENTEATIGTEIEKICEILMNYGFKGYDEQTYECIIGKFIFPKSFADKKALVENGIDKSLEKRKFTWVIIVFAVVLIALLFVLWKIFFFSPLS